MKKVFLTFFASFALLLLFSGVAYADAPPLYGAGCDATTHVDPAATGIVPCGVSKDSNGVLTCPCVLNHFFIMIRKIYVFITWDLALPLAGLLIVVGGVLLAISGANQGMYDLGKRVLWGALWGAVLIFGAWLIVKIIFMALGLTVDPGLFSF